MAREGEERKRGGEGISGGKGRKGKGEQKKRR